ncbi:MAG: nucleotidyltransferase domain-containing protein [Flavobacteriales bacterium]|nr:nucleotidyltransferase domain-containing protein [Flavobacteriales bacterium]
MIPVIENNLTELKHLCQSHKVKSMALFGSAANGVYGEASDIDLLVQFIPELDILDYADNYFQFLEKLEQLLGKKIDLVNVASIKNPVLKSEVDRSKIELYAA